MIAANVTGRGTLSGRNTITDPLCALARRRQRENWSPMASMPTRPSLLEPFPCPWGQVLGSKIEANHKTLASLASGQDVYMPLPRVTVCPATAEEWPVVERLAQLERHDLSQFRGYVPRADGTYAFDRLDLFRAEPARQAWLIRYGLTLAGFALTRPLESGGTSMSAFFIVRGLRRHGVGLEAARELLRLIPGVWGIAFQDENADAQPFWERVATDTVGDRWRLETLAGPEGHSPDIWLRLDTRSAP